MLLQCSEVMFFTTKERKSGQVKSAWFYFFLFLIWLGCIFTWKSSWSILPTIALTIGTVAYWQNNPKDVRAISLLSRPFWIIYSIYYLSIPGIIVEIIIGASTIVAIIRIDIKNKSFRLYLSELFCRLRKKIQLKV